jgi:glycosyltransferase involved in cell wall biosynthesis
VVLVADDAAEALLSRLRSLATVPTGIDFETVVFANGPDAAVLRVLDALSGDVTLASSPVRLDPAAAINEAVRMARAEIVAVINGNPVLTDGWLAGLVRAASADHVGLVGPQLLQTTGVLRHAGFDLHAAGGPNDTVVASARGTYLSPTHPRVAGDAAVDALGEDCVAFRAETWRRLGGIAAGWPLHEAVIDLGLRARLAGLSCIAVSDSRIIEGAARATAAESDRLGRHWIGRTDFAPLPAPRRSLSALMPTTTLIERLAGDYPISDTPRGDGINLVSEEHRAETEAWADALHATGVTVANHSWDGGALRYPDTAPFPFAATLLVLDGEVLTDYLAEAGIDSLRHRYTALAWDWPFEVASQDVGAISTTVNEIWVPSSFSKRALAAVSARPVLYVPPPLSFGPVPAAALDHLPDQVKFVTVARIGRGRDLDVEMTNPVGVIEAFRSAFRDGAGPTLQVVVTGRHRAEGLKRCTEVAAGRTDVSIVELSDDRHIAATVVDAHCAVSLHRSSAFNLDLARALAAGRPVISTAYGGPMDYLNAGVADLVGYRPVPIPGSGGSGSGSGASRLPAGASWAEPSRREAVAALRRVNDDYRQACQRAWLGRQLLNRSYGRRPVLQVLNRRLMPLRATSTRRDAQNRKSVGKS